MPLEKLQNGLVQEVRKYWAFFQERPMLALKTGLAAAASIWVSIDTLSASFSGGQSQNWGSSGRPLFGSLFESLPARILLFFVIVSALAWTISLVAAFLTARARNGRALASNLWFGFGGVVTIWVVDMVFRGVFPTSNPGFLFFSAVAILLSVYLAKANLMLTLETRSEVVVARARGLLFFATLACLVTVISYLPISA